MTSRGAIVLALLALPARAEVRALTFPSASLGREVSYVVDLPASYARGDKRYPVVYALHGLFEGPGFWERRGLSAILAGMRERQELPEFLVVAVDGGNSFFVNGPRARSRTWSRATWSRTWTPPTARFPARAHRALLGVSMGGYAALRIALKDPGRFVAVATHSAMLLEAIPSGGRRGRSRADGRLPRGLRQPHRRSPVDGERSPGPGREDGRAGTARALVRLRGGRPLRPGRGQRGCTKPCCGRGFPTRSSCPRATTATSTCAPAWRPACASSTSN